MKRSPQLYTRPEKQKGSKIVKLMPSALNFETDPNENCFQKDKYCVIYSFLYFFVAKSIVLATEQRNTNPFAMVFKKMKRDAFT